MFEASFVVFVLGFLLCERFFFLGFRRAISKTLPRGWKINGRCERSSCWLALEVVRR